MNATLLALAAGLLWGVGEVATKAVLHSGKVGPITTLALRSTIALPLIWIAYVVAMHVLKSPSEPKAWLQADSSVWFKLVLGSGIAAGAGAMICFYTAISLGEISRIKPIAFATAPAMAVLLGWLALGEEMTTRKGIAIGLILAGVVLLTGGKHKASESHDEQATQSPLTDAQDV